MPDIIYRFDSPEKFSIKEKEIFYEMLMKQGKVRDLSLQKINDYKILCTCLLDNEIVSIGAIKPKTPGDFEQADLPDLSKDFNWELGSCYTYPHCTGKGYSSALVKILIENCSNENLTAVTDPRSDNPMFRILMRVGFKQYGNVWKSSTDHGEYGLFLRFV